MTTYDGSNGAGAQTIAPNVVKVWRGKRSDAGREIFLCPVISARPVRFPEVTLLARGHQHRFAQGKTFGNCSL